MTRTQRNSSMENKQNIIKRISAAITGGALVTAIAAAVCPAQAVELKIFGTNVPAVDFHGFANQGYIVNTGHNDYLGGESHNGTYDFREYGVNGSITYGKLRVGAQIFAYDLGQYGGDKPQLDWGTADYQVSQEFGVRAGRVKMPRGLYNEALDQDSTRPFVLLPQSIYDARLRDFNSAFNGGMVYGNVELPKAGSIDYKFFGGSMDIPDNSGAIDYFNTARAAKTLSMGMDYAAGASLFWNLPITGLRLGYSANVLGGLNIVRQSATTGTYQKTADPIVRQMLSVEYTTGNWLFAAEGELVNTTYHLPSFKKDFGDSQVNYYVSASRRMNKWLELGTYWSYSADAQQTVPTLRQGDFAVAAKFDITDYLIFKLEAHYLDDAGKVFDTPSHPQPLNKRDTTWGMFDAKICFYF